MIKNIILYINNVLITLKQAQPGLIKVLSVIKKKLLLSDNGKKINLVLDAIYYLELMTISPASSSEKLFHETLTGHRMNTLIHFTIGNKPTLKNPISVPTQDLKILNVLHEKLMNIQSISHLAWRYNYRPNRQGHIENPAITNWILTQETIMNDSKHQALSDFSRDITIDGKQFKNKSTEEITLALKELISHSCHSEQHQALLVTWLLANGGQDMNRFVDACLLNQHILNKQYEENDLVTLGKTTAIVQNWKIGKKKQLNFDFAAEIKSLQYGINAVVHLNNQYELIIEKNMEKYNESLKRNKLPTMLFIAATVQLTIVENKIKLYVTKFNITSMTKALTISPKLLYAHSFFIQQYVSLDSLPNKMGIY